VTVREVHDLLAIAAVPTLTAAIAAVDWTARWFARSFNPAWLLRIKKRRIAAARRRRAKELLELADLVEIGQLHPDRARWLRLAAARLTAQP
jgi:hypothetical protein